MKTREQWIDIIKEAMRNCGTYQPAFDTTILSLSEILEQRDRTREEFTTGGGQSAIIFTTDRGQQNLKVNPLLKSWQDLNMQALQYLNSLGLTARGYKNLTGSVQQENSGTEFDDFLKQLGI